MYFLFDYCHNNDFLQIIIVIKRLISIIRYVIPIIIIIMGSLDFGKAVFASSEDNMKKSQKIFINRIILGIVIFIVPVLVDFLMIMIGTAVVNSSIDIPIITTASECYIYSSEDEVNVPNLYSGD